VSQNVKAVGLALCPRTIAGLVAAAAMGLAVACSAKSSGGAPEGASSDPCDPLAPPPTTLAAILGVGEDKNSKVYLVDTPDGGEDRVFVSNANTLYRQHVAGSGSSGAGLNAEYTFTFEDPSDYWQQSADGSTGQPLLVQVSSGVTTAMALGTSDGKNFLDTPGATSEPLTVVDAGAVVGMKLQNLPGIVQRVAEVSDGRAIVVTTPMDDYATTSWRLFYGTPSAMVERTVVNAIESMSGEADITFLVDSAQYTVHFTVMYVPDAGLSGEVAGPGSLDMGDSGTLPVTERTPAPRTLTGFSFTCIGP
jgi:hypothetical protein